MRRRQTPRSHPTVCAIIVATAILTIAGCDSRVRIKPVPVIYGPQRVDLCSLIPETRRTPDLQVFYATNRSAKGPADDRRYTNGVDENLRLGVATVRIGGADETWPEICRASSGGSENPPFELATAREFGRESDAGGRAAFADAINRHLAVTSNREVNVYVHGFRTNFNWEVEVMAKLFHCSGRRGAMVCFAWPSRQSIFLYRSDVDRGRASAHHLADLLERLAQDTQAEHINILAYSAGATVATEALVQLRARYPEDDPAKLAQRLRIGNVIFASSDIDLKTFAKTQIVQIKEVAQEVVIYISQNDSALGIASFFAGASRLGRPDLSELQLTREELYEAAQNSSLQVIDVSDVPGPHGDGGLSGHGYWYANDWVMTDLLVSFRWQVPAPERGLYRKPGKARWFFPSDYPEKVTAAVQRLATPATAPTPATTTPAETALAP